MRPGESGERNGRNGGPGYIRDRRSSFKAFHLLVTNGRALSAEFRGAFGPRSRERDLLRRFRVTRFLVRTYVVVTRAITFLSLRRCPRTSNFPHPHFPPLSNLFPYVRLTFSVLFLVPLCTVCPASSTSGLEFGASATRRHTYTTLLPSRAFRSAENAPRSVPRSLPPRFLTSNGIFLCPMPPRTCNYSIASRFFRTSYHRVTPVAVKSVVTG